MSYYQKVVQVTEQYLGPAAERFVRRQAEFHLHKPAEQITGADLTKLQKTLGVAVGILITDPKAAAEAVNQISERIRSIKGEKE